MSKSQHRLSLHPVQAQVYNDPHRFRVLTMGRRGGKSFLAIAEMIRAASKPKQNVWYIAPTYSMCRTIIWRDLLNQIPKPWVKSVHDTRLEIRLVNGSQISLKGAENGDGLRGAGLHFIIMDEVQAIHSEIWPVVIRPTLATTQGRALFIGTPSGFANLYDLHMMGQDPKNVDWMSWQFTTADSPFVSAAELESAKTDMDPKQYAQEFMAQFVNMSGRVYGFFDRKIHIKSCPFNPNLPICIGQDYNISPMSSICAQIQPNGEVWVVDEVVRYDSSVSDVCDVLESKYWRWLDKCIIYPDPAGSSRSHARGESAVQIFQERGFKNIRAFRKAPLIVDRVAAVNRMLENAKGEYRLFFDPSCVRTIASVDQTVYRQGTNEVDKKQSVEHSADALGYFISFEFPVRKHTITGLSM